MANMRKYGYFKPVKPNSRAWWRKRRREKKDAKTLGKQVRYS